MMKSRTAAALAAGALALAGLGPASLHAQTYPNRLITIIVGTSAGGTTDAVGRIYAAHAEKRWKQTIIVENRPGGGGALALRAIARAPADGYTIVSGASATHALFVKDAGFNYEDLTAATVVGVSRYGLMVSKVPGWKTLDDFIAFGKANPGKLNFGALPFSAQEVEVKNVQRMLGAEGAFIPYKGIGAVYMALIAGEIHATVHSNSPQVKAGQVVALAMGGPTRSPDMPNVPTFRELGYDYNPGANFVLYVRAGTPRDIIARIAAESAEVIKTAEFTERLTKPYSILGMGLSPEESAKYMDEEYERMKRDVVRAGIKPQ